MILDLEQPGKVKLPFNQKASVKSLLPILENVILFFLLFGLARLQAAYKLGTLNIPILYISISSILYGLNQVYLSYPLVLLLDFLTGPDGNIALSSYINGDLLFRFGFYVFLGLSFGYVIEIYKRKIKKKDSEISELTIKVGDLTNTYERTKEMNNRLIMELNASQDLLAKAAKWTRSLGSLDPDEVLNASVGVVEEMMKSKSVAIYMLGDSKNTAKLAVRSKNLYEALDSINKYEHSAVFDILKLNKIYINRTLDHQLPVMVAPIVKDDALIGMLAVYELEFEQMTRYYENLFLIAAGFVSTALSLAMKYKHDVKAVLFSDAPIGGTHYKRSSRRKAD